MTLTYTTTNILCAATDVGMHGLLAIVNRVTILCYTIFTTSRFVTLTTFTSNLSGTDQLSCEYERASISFGFYAIALKLMSFSPIG